MIFTAKIITAIVITALVGATIIIIAVVVGLQLADTCVTVSGPKTVTVVSEYYYTKINWSKPPEVGKCIISYRVLYMVDNDEQVTVETSDMAYQMVRLAACSVINVTVWSISEHSGEESHSYANTLYTEKPEKIEPPNSTSEPVWKDLLILWDKPAMMIKCRLKYALNITTDYNDYRKNQDTDQHSVLVYSSNYCFLVTFGIATIYNYTKGEYATKTFLHELQITGTHISIVEDTLIVTWIHISKIKQCSLYYVVNYITSKDSRKVSVTDARAEFDFKYCIEANVSISVAPPSPVKDAIVRATMWPSGRVDIFNLEIIQEEGERVIVWEIPNSLKECRAQYKITLNTDFGQYPIRITTTRYLVPQARYCYYINVTVQAIIHGIVGDPKEIANYEVDVTPPEEITFKTSHENNMLTVSWRNVDHRRCELQHEIIYKYGNIRDKETTIGLQIQLPIAYCTNATLTVVAFINSGRRSKEVTATHPEGDPPFLGPVQNIEIKMKHSYVHVFWDAPQYASECISIVYLVTAASGDQEASCVSMILQKRFTCHLLLVDYCPYTNFTIAPTSIVGVENKYTYSCEEATSEPITEQVPKKEKSTALRFNVVKFLVMHSIFMSISRLRYCNIY